MLKKLSVILALGALALPATLPVTTAHASEQIFSDMTGKFRGEGLVKASAKAKKESIRCRMTNKPSSTDGRLELGGNCAVSGFVFSLKGYIQQNGGRNSYTASMFRSLANLKQSDFSGKRSGSRINFNFKAFDRVSKSDVVATIRLSVKGNSAYDIQVSRTDPETGKVFDVGTIRFKKRG